MRRFLPTIALALPLSAAAEDIGPGADKEPGNCVVGGLSLPVAGSGQFKSEWDNDDDDDDWDDPEGPRSSFRP